MFSVANAVKSIAPTVSAVMGGEALLAPNFNHAELNTIVAAMMVLIDRGVDRHDAIFAYLYRHGCSQDRTTLSFILALFAGSHPDHCLWMADPTGRYSLLAPLHFDAFDDDDLPD